MAGEYSIYGYFCSKNALPGFRVHGSFGRGWSIGSADVNFVHARTVDIDPMLL